LEGGEEENSLSSLSFFLSLFLSFSLSLFLQTHRMAPDCAVVKMMLCLKYPDLDINFPLAGEL